MTPPPRLLNRPSSAFGDITKTYEKHLSTSLGRLGRLLGDHIEDTATGTRIRLTDGTDFLNCGGYGTFFVGAGHPHVVEKVTAQLRRRALSTKVLLDPVLAEAAERILDRAPDNISKVYFSPSGTDAVEVARKLCLANGHDHAVSFTNGFHGKTLGALGLTHNKKYTGPFETQIYNSYKVLWGDTNGLAEHLARTEGRCAVFIEPIQSEAGVCLPPPGFLDGVAEAVKKHGAILVADEIMTGLGRCGRWWQSADIQPDIVIAGKALSAGVVPVAATMCTEELHRLIDNDPFVHTSTFGGTPLQAAAVNAVLDVIESDGLVQRSAEVGKYLLAELRNICDTSGIISDVRGAGTLIGIECINEGFGCELFIALLSQGLIANHSLNQSAVVRLTPPATITDIEITELIEKFLAALKQVQRMIGRKK
jgi:putrescine aminotransferase